VQQLVRPCPASSTAIVVIPVGLTYVHEFCWRTATAAGLIDWGVSLVRVCVCSYTRFCCIRKFEGEWEWVSITREGGFRYQKRSITVLY